MQTLSAQDALFLRVESPSLHMHIASVGIYAAPRPPREAILAAIAGRLPRVPRYRQKVRFVPLELGQPVWVDDPDFELDYHLRFTALPAPGGDAELCTLVGRVLSRQLDRDRPLWELWVADGLAGGAWALIAKMHHCLADGVSSVDLFSALLDTDPDHPPAPIRGWHPAPGPSTGQLLAGALGEGVRDGVAAGRDLIDAARHPARAVGELIQLGRELSAVGRLSPPTSLNGTVGPNRRWQLVRGQMQDVKAIRAFHGCTINDVVLAAITAGVRDLLLARGEDVTERVVRTLVPVSVRTIGRDGTSGNHVSGLFPELPVALSDPADRLIAIREQMQARKRAHEAEGGEILMALGELTPSVLLALGEHQATAINRHFVQTIATNVPGPRQTLYLAGCELLECFPFVPLGPSMRVSVAILSYGTALNLGVTGDYDHAPDIAILCAGIKRGIAELLATTRPA